MTQLQTQATKVLPHQTTEQDRISRHEYRRVYLLNEVRRFAYDPVTGTLQVIGQGHQIRETPFTQSA